MPLTKLLLSDADASLVALLGFILLFHVLIQQPEVMVYISNLYVVFPEFTLADMQRSLVELKRLLVIPLLIIDSGQVVVDICSVNVVCPKERGPYLKAFFI